MKQSVVNNIVRRAFELGINYYDTAEVYNEGKSELALGIALYCIRNKVFIGSNSSLVAPLKVDKFSVVGAGSVITKNVEKKSLALTSSP